MSTKTKAPPTETAEGVEGVEEEIVNLDKEISSMEAELEEKERPLVWDEAGTVEEIAAQEHRLAVLPRLIRAAKVKRAELSIRREQERVRPVEEEQRKAREALEAATAKRLEAVEEENAARFAWGDAHARVERVERRIKNYQREIKQLKGEV